MAVHAHFDVNDTSIYVGSQHISRLTHAEVREIVCQCLMFGGKELREEIRGWLSCKEVESVAQVIAPEKNAASEGK